MKSREEKSRREKEKELYRRKEATVTGAPNVRKVAKHCVFPMICGSGGSKSRLAIMAGAECRCTRSTFTSQNVKNIRGSGHLWAFRCQKMARRGGTKHISKSKSSVHFRRDRRLKA